MRSMFLPTLALASFLTLPALAEDSAKSQAPAPKAAPVQKDSSTPKVQCDIHDKHGGRVVQGTNLVINAGEKTKSAVAIDGDVVVRKGAVVDEDVVAIHGKVIIEEGAKVRGDAVSLGGALHLQKNAQVGGDAVSLGGTLQMDEGASVSGDRVNFSLLINGSDIAKSFLEKALKNSDCHLTLNDDDGDRDDDDDDHDEDDHDD